MYATLLFPAVLTLLVTYLLQFNGWPIGGASGWFWAEIGGATIARISNHDQWLQFTKTANLKHEITIKSRDSISMKIITVKD